MSLVELLDWEFKQECKQKHGYYEENMKYLTPKVSMYCSEHERYIQKHTQKKKLCEVTAVDFEM